MKIDVARIKREKGAKQRASGDGEVTFRANDDSSVAPVNVCIERHFTVRCDLNRRPRFIRIA